MRVIAQRGDPGTLLVQTREAEGLQWGRIWNVERREMSQEMPVPSIAKFGYWEAYTGPAIDASAFEGVRLMQGRPR